MELYGVMQGGVGKLEQKKEFLYAWGCFEAYNKPEMCLGEDGDGEHAACKKKCQTEIYADYYDRITKGFELVFGNRPSVGFICGIKEAVVNHQADLPGYCCMDAPFQLDNANWGNEVSVELESDS
jgi:hypothetical protein